jgi:hypothetical protein
LSILKKKIIRQKKNARKKPASVMHEMRPCDFNLCASRIPEEKTENMYKFYGGKSKP